MAAPGDDRGEREEAPQARPGARYSTWVGVAFLVIIVVATLNTIRTDDSGVLGTVDVAGEPLAEFAVPDIRGDLDGDANIAQDDCETSRNPCPEGDRRTPACRVDPDGALRICDFFDRPLAISFWFTDPEACVATQDDFDDVARRYRGRVNFLSVAVRGEREEIERIVSQRGWSVPVGWDRDGAVSNIYRVGVCPTVAFAYPGGIFEGTAVGAGGVSREALTERLDRLLRESRRRAANER